jgi:hypothetical protein
MLFLVLCAIPAGLLMIAGLFATLAGQTRHFDLGPGSGLLIVALCLISLISFFRATSTMAHAAEAMPDSTPDTMALPRATMLHGR